MAALSHGEDIEPIEGRMPCSRMVLESGSDTYCEPWSLQCMHPLGVVSPGQGHLQLLVGQLGRDVGPHGPARDPPQSYVHYKRRVQPALPGLHIGDVGDGLAALSWTE